MTPLPVLKNECLPRCGECCGGATPLVREDVERLLEWWNADPRRLKALEKQLRFWGSSPAACPFLDKHKRCSVYEARPSVCRVFGHTPAMECPKGVRFDEWTPERVVRALGGDPFAVMIGDGEKFVPTQLVMAAALGDDLLRAMKRAKGGLASLEVRTLPADEYSRIIEELHPKPSNPKD